MKEYEHLKLEKKWQAYWDKTGIYRAKENSQKPKFYGLIEFPYPSGSGLHVGHIRSNTAMDIIGRKRRMEGYNVLYPIGWDAFGLPTENYAIKTGIHPVKVTKDNTDTFRRQLKALGFSFDWSREVNTTDPKYYKWTQWIFLQFFKHGLAYKTRTEINWCPSCKIGLANEEVVGGMCDRCGGPTEKREKEQWMLAITKYALRLDRDLDLVDYLPKIKTQQRNWIGKSEGAEIDFALNSKNNYILLHGFGGSSEEIFFPWLKKELTKAGLKYHAPDLPNTENPTEEEQVNFVLQNCKFDQSTILFGHSLGAVVAMKVLEKLDKKIAGLVLAGGFTGPDFKDRPRPFDKTFNWKFDFNKIRKHVGFVKILSDPTDYAIPLEQGRILSGKLDGVLVEATAGQPHFTNPEEPLILENLVSKIKVFTTRPDTIFGATYMVLSPEHPMIKELVEKSENKDAILRCIIAVKKKTEIERTAADKEKTGVELKGIKAINPATGKEISVWTADYVLAHYGTGAIMAVPADDERDREFAEKYGLPIVENYKKAGFVDFGRKITRFKLRDWVFSRQRYWGEPIPLINCEKCGWVPVPEKDLPVELPKVKNYQPTDSGESPLANISKWVNTKCPKCKGKAKRETDTMPNWAGSSWYFLRYT